MALFRWGSPLDAFRDLEREMDEWMRQVDLAFEGLRHGRPFPALNLYELESEYLITAELPGCEADDLEISVTSGALTLSGQRSPMGDVPENRYRRSERPAGSWERVLALPDRIQDDAIRAELTNGLLKLYLPKLPSSAPRQIAIESDQQNLPSKPSEI